MVGKTWAHLTHYCTVLHSVIPDTCLPQYCFCSTPGSPGGKLAGGARDSTRLAGARHSLGRMEKDKREAGTYGKGRQRPGSSVSPLLALLLLLLLCLTSSWALVGKRHNMRL